MSFLSGEAKKTLIKETCPECEGELYIIEGKNGKFIGCGRFLEGCDYTRAYKDENRSQILVNWLTKACRPITSQQ